MNLWVLLTLNFVAEILFLMARGNGTIFPQRIDSPLHLPARPAAYFRRKRPMRIVAEVAQATAALQRIRIWGALEWSRKLVLMIRDSLCHFHKWRYIFVQCIYCIGLLTYMMILSLYRFLYMFQYLEIAGTYDILQPPERIIKTRASPVTKWNNPLQISKLK